MDVLGGIRVLELGDGIAPSVTGMLLADFGADVIKVEPPAGARSRARPGSAAWNRGKRSVTVPDGAGGPWLAASAGAADVVILGAGQALADWGPEVAAAAAANPGLVTTRMPPYLAGGTPWAGGRESDALLAAHAGVSWRQACDDGAPVDSVYPLMTYVQGAWAAACTVAALVERGRSGWGQEVTVSGVNAVTEACVSSLTANPNAPDLNTAVGGVGRHPTYRPVRAADGWLACGALGGKFESRLLAILGIGHILDDPRLAGQVTNMLRPDVTPWVMEQVSAAFRQHPRDHWVRELVAAGIPAGPLLDRAGWLDHPQVVANDLRVTVEDPERGTVVMPGVPLCLTATPGKVTASAPLVGEHDGADPWPARDDRPAPAGLPPLAAGPLNGFRVLNLGTFVATPYAGFLLSELGADVIKVEPLTGDPYRRSGFGVNRGMRSLAIDLASTDGVSILHRLIPGVDAVTVGMRPGVADKLGVGYQALRQVKEDIITVSLAAYGEHGEMARSGGVDMVLQAMSGMMLAQGNDESPVGNTIAIIDVTTAILTTLATVLALLHRERTGEGQHAWDSLLGTSTFLGLGELVRYEGRPPAVRGGVDFKGPGPLDRFYPVADGWIRVQATEPVSADDLRAAGLDVAEVTTDAIGGALAALPAERAVACLAAGGVPAAAARRLSAVYRDGDLKNEEFVHLRRADDGTTIATPGRYATFSRTQRQGPLTPAGIGEHTREVLELAGLDEAGIDAAIDAKVVAAGGRGPIQLGAVYR
jgi:crotonobetainyl-CoA:carnitine CoA-transferase CaiB-like acyl-CoA transferase